LGLRFIPLNFLPGKGLTERNEWKKEKRNQYFHSRNLM